jgi:curli biogenesis system outer membrane secretion channel CsgG
MFFNQRLNSGEGDLTMWLRLATTLALALTVMFSTGCANVYPVSTGSHATIQPVNPDKSSRAVVWGNHPAVVNAATQTMQEMNVQVVERTRLKEILNEQKVRLTNTSDDETELLKAGRLLGADQIIFADATVNSKEVQRVVDSYAGLSQAETVYQLSVSVRNVSIETGEVRWSGTATYPTPVTKPDEGLIDLTRHAMSHAVCPLENGYTWDEQAGCRKPQ